MTPAVAIALSVIAVACLIVVGVALWSKRPSASPSTQLVKQASRQLALAERAVERGRPGLANDYVDLARQLMEMANKETETKP